MDTKEAIQEFLDFDPKLLTGAADKIVGAIKVFQDSEKEIGIQLKKVRRARMIAFRVKRMKERCPNIAISIECEIAVIEAQKIINS